MHQLINLNLEQLNCLIIEDDGPKRREKAKIALTNLIDSLNTHIYNVDIKVA